LTNNGTLGNGGALVIDSGATFDVSGVTGGVFNLAAKTNVLVVSGLGTSVGTTASTIIGAANGTINLASQAVTMNYDGSHPALYVPQGTLRLSGNPITVNTTSGKPLTNGTYVLAQQDIGNIVSGGNFSLYGSALSVGATTSITASNNLLLLTISNASGMSAPLSGTAGTGSYYVGLANGLFDGNNWYATDTTNSSAGAFAGLVSSVGYFNISATNRNETVNFDQYAGSYGGLVFNNTGTTTVTNMGNSVRGPGGFANGDGSAQYGFVVNSGAGAVTIGTAIDSMYLYYENAPVNTFANQTWLNNSTNRLTINAQLISGVANANNILTFAGSGNTLINGAISQYDASRKLALTYAGSGTLTLATNNTYVNGTTIQSGTIALTNSGTLGTGNAVIIDASGTLDVSGLATNNFVFNANQALVAGGMGTIPGSTAATIKGKSGGTVSLGSQSATFNYDTMNPALYISQGTLVLSNNTFIINTPGSIPLNTNKTYVLAQQASGNMLVNGSSFSAYGTAFTPGYTYSIYVVNNQLLLSFGLPYWDASGTNWQNTSSWSTVPTGPTPDPSAVPGVYDIPVFNITPSNNVAQTVSLNGNVTVAGMVFNNSNSTAINGGNGSYTLTLADPGVTINPGGGSVTFGSTNLSQQVNNQVTASQTWSNAGPGTLTLLNSLRNSTTNLAVLTLSGAGNINLAGSIMTNGSGIGRLTLDYNGTGQLTILNPTNSFTGGLMVEQGMVLLGSAATANTMNGTFGRGMLTLGNAGQSLAANVGLGTGYYTNGLFLAPTAVNPLILRAQNGTVATWNGGVTGANNLVLYESGNGLLNFSNAPINHAGSLTVAPDPNAGPTNGLVNIYAPIGANVTSVTVTTNGPAGTNTLMLAGTNLYTGTTYIGGTLGLTGTATMASTNLSLSAGGLLDVSSLSSTFTLVANQVVTAGTGTGFINGNADFSAGGVTLNYTNGTLPLALANGSLTLSTNTVFTVNVANPLAAGTYPLISVAGTVTGALPPVIIANNNIPAGAIALLQLSGTNINLIIAGQPVATNLSILLPTGANLNLPISNLATNWSDPNGTNVNLLSMATTSTRGFAVNTNGGIISYVATSAGADTISYVIVDGYGATNTGTISITAANPTMPPVITPASGGYVSPQTVTITNAEPGATIYYTTNGTVPTTASASGTSPVTIVLPANTNGFVISAIAVNAGEFNSAVVSATYSTIATPTWINPVGGSWTNAVNWSNNVVANAPGVSVDFSELSLSLNPVPVSLDAALTAGALAFGDATGTNGWLVTPGNGGGLTLDNGTNQPVINVVNGDTTITAPIDGVNGLVKTGTGTLTLAATNPITGSIVVSNGTLALANAEAIANSTNIVIPAGGTVDVSAIINFTLSASNTLTALGRGTNVGDTAATLIGAAGGTVSLGSSQVTLDIDGSNPALFVSQGTLVLNQNPFTINSASPLGYGDYVLAQSTDGITGSGPFTVDGTALGVGSTGTIMVVGNQLILHVMTPVVIYPDNGPATNTLTGGASGIIFSDTNGTQVNGAAPNNTLLLGPGGITADPGPGGGTIGSTNADDALNVALDGSQTWTNNSDGPITLGEYRFQRHAGSGDVDTGRHEWR
jgi:fibronectin-binding autotransporter adhesin